MQDILQQKAMLVTLNIGVWTGKKQDKKVSREVDRIFNANNAGIFTKYLVEKDWLKPIEKVKNEARMYHYEMTLAWLDNGLRMLPVTVYFEYVKNMQNFQKKFYQLVEEKTAEYRDAIEYAKRRLNGLFNPLEYPTPEEFKIKFYMEFNFYPVPHTDDFRITLAQDEVAKIQKEVEQRLRQTTSVVFKDLIYRVKEVLERVVDRTDGDKVFRDSLIENAEKIAKLIPKMNIFNNPELNDIAKEIETKIAKFSPDVLRQDAMAKAQVNKDAKELLDKMKTYF